MCSIFAVIVAAPQVATANEHNMEFRAAAAAARDVTMLKWLAFPVPALRRVSFLAKATVSRAAHRRNFIAILGAIRHNPGPCLYSKCQCRRSSSVRGQQRVQSSGEGAFLLLTPGGLSLLTQNGGSKELGQQPSHGWDWTGWHKMPT